METFLTKDEIKILTGYSYKKKQCQELNRNGIKFMVNPRFGNPLVLRKELESLMCTKSHISEPALNLKALNEV
jgi:hypothetical protein